MKEGFTVYMANVANTIKFTTNSAVNFVPAVLIGTPLLVSGVVPYPYFAPGDNIIIEALSCRLPFCFGQAEILCQLHFEWVTKDGLASGSLSELGNLGQINIPYANSEHDINTFVPLPGLVGAQAWGIRVAGITFDISMINMPAALDATELDIYVSMRIHTTHLLES